MAPIVGSMLAVGPTRLPARVGWPLHQALCELDEEAHRNGLAPRLGFSLVAVACPDVGRRVRGADAALRQLRSEGALAAQGALGHAVLTVQPEALVAYRRWLLTLDPEVVRLVYRAGERWEALLWTWTKNRSTSLTSVAPTVASGTPKRLHPPPGLRTCATRRRAPRPL